MVKNPLASAGDTFDSWSVNILEFPCGSAGKESACNVGNLGSIPGLGRSPREGKSYLLQYFHFSSLYWEDPTCQGAAKPMCHNY